MTIKQTPASTMNYGVGRNGLKVNKVVLHWMDGTLSSTDAHFANPASKVSAHYGIGQSEIHQYVQESDTAYHAGNLTVNRESIGIEHEGGTTITITEAVINQSIELVTDICKRYSIPADREHIKKHSEIKATQCPGTLPIDRIVEEVAKKLSPPDPMKIKVDLGDPWGVQEVQAIKSILSDQLRDLTAAQEKGKILDGFVSKWVAQWNLPVGSSLVEVEAEMAKLMPAEEAVQTFRDSIEACVGNFPKDDLLLEAHKTVRRQIEDQEIEISILQQKLSEAKTPVGYKFVKTWDIYSLRFKLYRKDVK